MGGVNAYKDRVVSTMYKGLHRAGEEPQDHRRRGRGPARRARRRPGRRPPADRARSRGPGHRLLLPQPARPRGRRHHGHHQRARADARPRAGVGDRARRRRHRRRVRQRLEVVRRRRHDRRGAARTCCRSRTRTPPSCSSGRSASAASTSRSACASPASRPPTPASPSPSRTARPSRPSCCSSPSAADRSPQGLGYEEVGVAMERGFVLVDEHCQTNVPNVYAVGDLRPGPAARPRRLRRGHHGRRAARRAQPAGRSTTTACPRVTYSEPEVASVGLTAAQAREARLRRSSRSSYDLAGNGRAQILEDRRRGQARRGRRTARSSASTWSAAASASSSPRPS